MLELINSTGSYFLGYPVLIEHLLVPKVNDKVKCPCPPLTTRTPSQEKGEEWSGPRKAQSSSGLTYHLHQLLSRPSPPSAKTPHPHGLYDWPNGRTKELSRWPNGTLGV